MHRTTERYEMANLFLEGQSLWANATFLMAGIQNETDYASGYLNNKKGSHLTCSSAR